MVRKWTIFSTGFLVVLGGLCIARWSWACGPNFRDIRYDDPGILDVPRTDVSIGHYGVLRQGLPWSDLIQVYRSLQMYPQPEFQGPLNPKPSGPDGGFLWRAERAKVVGDAPPPIVATSFDTGNYVTVNNVGNDALVVAAQTLASLVKSYGKSPSVKDWVAAQDLVFASTPLAPRIPTPVQELGGLVHAPGWLVQERAYQVAAAQFYSGQWDLAEQGFRRLATEQDHPRRAWGMYLAARCWIRKGEISVEGLRDFQDRIRKIQERAAAAQKDPALAALPIPAWSFKDVDELTKMTCYQEAQALLKATLADPARAAAHPASQEMLELVRYRTEPLSLLGDFLKDQGQAKPTLGDDEAEAKIADAFRFLRRYLSGKAGPVEVPGDSGLALWLGAMAGNVPWHVDAETALARWRVHPDDTWLVAALSLARQQGPELNLLVEAAKKIPPQSPLSPTIKWHLLRLELAGLKGDALAQRLDSALHGGDLSPWIVNRLRTARQALAQDPVTWLTYASRRPTATVDDGLQLPDMQSPTETFDEETAQALGDQLPLERVGALLKESRLPSVPAQEFAKAAWTKAVLLEAWDHARVLGELLPPTLRPVAAKALAPTEPTTLRFQAALVIMEWPGLRPSVESGLGRQFLGPGSEKAPLAAFDMLRDNWWCGSDNDQPIRPRKKPGVSEIQVPGLSDQEHAAARKEKALLEQVPSAQVWFGRAVLAFAKSNPGDERVPYALHRFVWTTRSPQCMSDEAKAIGKEAFQKLHKAYPKSPWTNKTPYYF